MTRIALAFAPLLLAGTTLAAQEAAQESAPAPTATPALNVSQTAVLRCGITFAMIDAARRHADPRAAGYPELGNRGREFFVQSMARLIDETGMTREALTALVKAESTRLGGEGLAAIDQRLPACLLMLDASGV